MILKSILVLFLNLLALSAFAQETYHYPYANADVATLSTVLMKSTFDSRHAVQKLMEVPSIAGRNQTFLFEGRGNFRFGFFPQNHEAPLVFIIADLGGSHVSGYMTYEAELLYKNGFNVITISSPFFWNFVISSSQTTLPGITDEDARDLYEVMQKALTQVKKEHSYRITNIGLIGLGFGGLEAAHLSTIESTEKKLNIKRYVLINPVVNLVSTVTQIEKHAAIALEIGMNRVAELKSKAFNFVVDNMDRNTNDADYFLNLQSRFPLSNQEYQFLVGGNLRSSLGDTIFASQQVHDLGILKSPISKYHWDERHAEVNKFGYLDYFQKMILPEFKKYNFFTIQKHINMDSVEPAMHENANMFLMHNTDDPLMSAAQLATLQTVFGPERSKFYPLGGHLGNLWYSQNQKDLLKILVDLK